MLTLQGTVTRLTYQNPDNHYTVARFFVDQTEREITAVGHLPGVTGGENLTLTGAWETHARFGEQFKISSFEIVLPQAVKEIRRYLASGFIKGLGPKTVARIVDHFGDETLAVIENEPVRLAQVKGIGAKTAQRIGDTWRQQHAVRRLVDFLHQHGVPSRYSARIFNLYGSGAAQVLDADPYRIAQDLPGLGFRIADAIAVSKGLDREDPGRARACLLHSVATKCEAGHSHALQEELINRCGSRFDISPTVLDYHLAQLAGEGYLVTEDTGAVAADTAVYLPALHHAEQGIAHRITAMATIAASHQVPDAGYLADTILSKLALVLSKQQQEALEALLGKHVAILTGGPGTGKTTLVRALTVAYEAMGMRVTLAAPTGRAAKRLSEVCRRKAATVHRLLRADPHSDYFGKNRDDPIDTDVLIVDEMSMVDLRLMYHLLEAVHLRTVFIMVGDVYQLPPVGPGNVLADLIASERVACVSLKEIFRQALESPIITNAHRVRRGRLPLLPGADEQEASGEFVFIEQGAIARAGAAVAELCRREIPGSYGLDPIQDIQVITPTHKGDAGTLNINKVLQQALNPSAGAQTGRLGMFRMGDKVMHLKNNYQKDVYNGDIGVVRELEPGAGRLAVDFDGHQVSYEGAELEELSLAYAITVHKSQGSEYPAVVLLLFSQHHILLQRNLLYTAMTRGRQLVVILGHRRALQRALANDKPQRRLSGLVRRLREE